jgi:hypothetical protein
MRDRRRVGLVDHSDQRDREITALEGGFISTCLAAAGSCFRNLEEAYILWQGQKGSVGTHSLSLKQLLKGQPISDVGNQSLAHPQRTIHTGHHIQRLRVNSSILVQQKQRGAIVTIRVQKTARVTSNQRTIDSCTQDQSVGAQINHRRSCSWHLPFFFVISLSLSSPSSASLPV